MGEKERKKEKGLEWVERVTEARQPMHESYSYSTPSCTTTLHKQSFPFSLRHKQHSWELTATGRRANAHTHTHAHAAYVHMFTGKEPRAQIDTNVPLSTSLLRNVTGGDSCSENNSKRLKCNTCHSKDECVDLH